MSNTEIFTLIAFIVFIPLAYGLGHLHGQAAALKWKADLDQQFDRIYSYIPSASGLSTSQDWRPEREPVSNAALPEADTHHRDAT